MTAPWRHDMAVLLPATGRHATAYGKAAGLLSDLRAIADERGTVAEFTRRLQAIRERHAGKKRFLDRLAGME